MKTYYIYKITNPKGAIYIGQTKNLIKKKKHYEYVTCKEQKKIYNSLKKYGWKNHKFDIIYKTICNSFEIDRIEIFFIDFFKSYWKQNIKRGLNLTIGGKGTSGASTEHLKTKEYREKCSISRKGHIVSEETRIKIGNAHRGKKHSEEFKKIQSEAQKKRYLNREEKDKRSIITKKYMKQRQEAGIGIKLTKELVLEIIKDLNNGGSSRQLAIKFNVDRSTILNIRSGKSWNCISKDLLDSSKFLKSGGQTK